MKKFILAIVFLSSISASGFSQSNPAFTLGPKVGINHSNFLANKQNISREGIQAYQAGVFVRLGFLKSYIQPEAYYNFKSTSLQVRDAQTGGSTNFSGHLKFNNIDVPVLLGSNLIDAKVFKLRVFAGPMVSFLLKDQNSERNFNPDNYDFNNKIWGGQAGIGIDVGNITFDCRYQTQLTRISKILQGPESAIHFSVGIKLF